MLELERDSRKEEVISWQDGERRVEVMVKDIVDAGQDIQVENDVRDDLKFMLMASHCIGYILPRCLCSTCRSSSQFCSLGMAL